jgi:hypothetical protein
MTNFDPCFDYPALQTPPQSVPSLKFIVGIDSNGNQKLLQAPAGKALFYFDGANIYGATGQMVNPIEMPAMWKTTGVTQATAELLISDGEVWKRLTNTTSTKQLVKLVNSKIVLEEEEEGLQMPEAGSGLAFRPDGEEPFWFSTPGMYYVDDEGDIHAIEVGSEAEVLTIDEGVPVFKSISGNVATGAGVANLDTVVAASQPDGSISIQIPIYQLTDGTDTVSVTNVNETVDFANGLGIGGLDTGAEENDQWYYVGITSDGVGDVGAIISASSNAPDLAATAHSYYALASVFRNDGGTMVDFIQKGRRFQTPFQLWGNNLSITGTFGVISSGTNLNTLVPPLVKKVRGIVGGSTTETAGRRVIMASNLAGNGYFIPGGMQAVETAFDSFKWDASSFELLIGNSASPALYWKSHNGVASNRRRIGVTGYDI